MAPRGLDRLIRQMRALPEEVRKASRQALEESMAEIAGAVERAAPDAKLKKSVGHGPKPPATRATGAFRPSSAELNEVLQSEGLRQFVWAGGDEAFWARWTEFGTAPHSLAKGASRKR